MTRPPPRSTRLPYTTLFRSEALHKGELIAIPILILVVLLVFRSPVAAAIPLLIAAGTVVMGFGILSLILRSEEHTSELQSLRHLVCRLLLENKNSSETRRHT